MNLDPFTYLSSSPTNRDKYPKLTLELPCASHLVYLGLSGDQVTEENHIVKGEVSINSESSP